MTILELVTLGLAVACAATVCVVFALARKIKLVEGHVRILDQRHGVLDTQVAKLMEGVYGISP